MHHTVSEPTVNGYTVCSFSTHGQQSAAKGSLTTVSRSGTTRSTQHLDLLGSWFAPEVALNRLFPSQLHAKRGGSSDEVPVRVMDGHMQLQRLAAELPRVLFLADSLATCPSPRRHGVLFTHFLAHSPGKVGDLYILPDSSCKTRTHAPTGTQWFTITGTHTFITSGTRTLMSQHQLHHFD
jgi:hypothetical protein